MAVRTALVAALVSALGCGPSVRLVEHHVLEPVRDLAEDAPVQVVSRRVNTPLRVFVLEPLQGLHMRNSSEDRRAYETYALPAPPRQGMGPQELELFYTGFYDQMNAQHGTNLAVRFPDYAQALQESLQRHLGAYFSDVVVERVAYDRPPPTEGFVIQASGGAVWKMTKTAALSLHTQGPAPLAPVTGEGRRSSGAHLGWAIPVMLLLGLVLGAAIVNPIMAGINRRHMVGSVATAIEQSAQLWAAQIAAAHRTVRQ